MNFIQRVLLAGMVFFAFVAVAEDCGPLPKIPGRTPTVEIAVVKSRPGPVLSVQSPDAKGILGGFEGGTVVKTGGRYHAFMTEMTQRWDDPDLRFARTRLGDWVSPDGIHWRRVRTIFSSTDDYTGKDRRAALWAPMPIYNRADRQWNLFYVAYRSKPNTPDGWYENYDGELVRAVSQVKGRKGIDGPYKDAGVILRPGPDSDKWEGLQGTDSVYPYRADGRWFTFYGSAQTGHLFRVGLASAPKLSGAWKRCSSLNPVPLERMVENPIVSKIGGVYVAIYNVDVVQPKESIGYAASLDGVHWNAGKHLLLFPLKDARTRTPLALIPNADGTFDLFLTALSTVSPTDGGKKTTAEGLYLFKVRVSVH